MHSESHIAYLGLGSNLGDRAAHLLRALIQLQRHGVTIQRISSLYQTAPVEQIDQPEFLNLVVAVVPPSGDPFELLALCLQIEAELGRVRTVPKGARVIDLDVLLFDDLVIDETRDHWSLTVPHPRLHLRRFVLAPLAEIAPTLEHPILGERVAQLHAALQEEGAVQVY